jgi:hypothetical protein
LKFRGNAMPISSNATSLSRLGHGPHARGFEPSERSGRVPQVQQNDQPSVSARGRQTSALTVRSGKKRRDS